MLSWNEDNAEVKAAGYVDTLSRGIAISIWVSIQNDASMTSYTAIPLKENPVLGTSVRQPLWRDWCAQYGDFFEREFYLR